MKYNTWNVHHCQPAALCALTDAGISPLAAAVLCSRGCDTPQKVADFLQTGLEKLHDPLRMADMDKAIARIRQAMASHEKIAVYGDYDVDGITSTCLLTDFLQWQGANVVHYIPARIEEGYGLNAGAVRQLAQEGVGLIITVDCGITAIEEAALCRELGLDLIITDHHECREVLPDAVAVVDPHRRDCGYPFSSIAGVGVAFKLVSALYGSQRLILERYGDLVSLGTVADVMPLEDENRTLVRAGLQALQATPRLGLQALMRECNCDAQSITAGTIGYMLAPRINAAGRMEQVGLATRLFLTQDPQQAASLAAALCQLNHQRQSIEAEIYRDAVQQLTAHPPTGAIVLAGATWHQGVVGIVASRLAEEYGCPTFLICLDGSRGKASSRSYGGFNLYAALEQLSDLLDSYGGHELAAGFTIQAEQIDVFRQKMSALAADYVAAGKSTNAVELDYEIQDTTLLSRGNVADLALLEPTGAGYPRPAFYMQGLLVDRINEVGGGKHLKLRLRHQGQLLNAIFFSTTAAKCGILEGDCVEIAFTPQLNEFRGSTTVQLTLTDLRLCAKARQAQQEQQALYEAFAQGQALTTQQAQALLPPRTEFVAIWKYLKANQENGRLSQEGGCLSRKISQSTGIACSYARLRICLDVLQERGLLQLEAHRHSLNIVLTDAGKKVDLMQSGILIQLQQLASTTKHI